jgi:L-serine dehydratase
MSISVFDLFKIGIGPSSSHTVGPMIAAQQFADELAVKNGLETIQHLQVDLFGSLGATGKGHGSDKAVLLGLEGEAPDQVDVNCIEQRLQKIRQQKAINLSGRQMVPFNTEEDLIFHRKKSLPGHPNGLRFRAQDSDGRVVLEKVFYSVGGGFVLDESDIDYPLLTQDAVELPHSFSSGGELLALCQQNNCAISDIMFENEQVWRSKDDIYNQLVEIWQAMQACVQRGCEAEGILPGGLKVRRRAAGLHKTLTGKKPKPHFHAGSMDWVNLYALAVNEENASGGRIVTAPTNGAAGIIPAVLHYYHNFCESNEEGIVRFLLTAGAIGILFKENASISGAEVGCQGEVGSACSMAAAGLTEVLGGTPEQVENAAEIGIEHNLGLTCDPIGGLVQIPCIERNAMAAVKAINASRMALCGDGTHYVSLDKAIHTMRETGQDMREKYKETARGGLALHVIDVPVNIVDC